MKTLPLILLFTASLALSSQSDTGEITGRVLDMNGLPAAGVRVALASPDANGKITSEILNGLTVTDSTGRYRIANISPGRYGIVAGAVASPTFYPGTASLSGATVLTVQPGSTTELDFALVTAAPLPGRQYAPAPPVPLQNRIQLNQNITAPAQAIVGRIVVDGPDISSFLPKLTVTFSNAVPLPNSFVVPRAGTGIIQGATFVTSTEVKLDNSFRLELKPMLYRISVGRTDGRPLKGFVVKSITMGTIDLLKEDLQTYKPVSGEIIITLQPVPMSNPIKL